jgi:hypothetical protein
MSGGLGEVDIPLTKQADIAWAHGRGNLFLGLLSKDRKEGLQ